MASFFGIYRATIVNTGDPMANGRIQASVPAVAAGTNQWALPCRPPQAGRQQEAPQLGATA
jgi:hypothetical protein